MQKDTVNFLRTCVSIMIRPIVELCVARGIRFQDFMELAKGVFIRSAEDRLRRSGHEVSSSRLSVMTGIQRPEVGRLRSGRGPERSKDFITRVVGQWVSDKRFVDRRKRPRSLSFEGMRSEFARLVYAVSTDLNPHTVRFELERVGLVKVHKGKLSLLRPAHISSSDPTETLRHVADDARDIIEAASQNAFVANDVPNLHARTQYDNVPDESLVKIRRWFLEIGERIHRECRSFLSTHDRDLNREMSKGSGRNRVVLGTYSLVDRLDTPETEEE